MCDTFDESTYTRGDAKHGDLKPASCNGCLDVDAIKKHGLTVERMQSDPLFFLQLLLPICDTKRSGIEDDQIMPFFIHACTCTNVYALGEKSWGDGTGHKFGRGGVCCMDWGGHSTWSARRSAWLSLPVLVGVASKLR